jgi:glycosyltransferase involved in cell wall biosynthesis
MRQALVSVIIPLYNSADHIAETLQCIYNQSYTNIEVIIVDDGSIDKSYDIACEHSKGNTKIIKQRNKGASAARNVGLKLAKGDFIQFLDADDLISSNKIENQVVALINNNQKLTICSTVHFLNGTSPYSGSPSSFEETFLYDDNDSVHFLINLMGGYSAIGSMIPIHAWLVPKQIIEKVGEWNETISMDDDGEYFCRIVLNAKGIIKTQGFCYYRRSLVNSSLSSKTNLKSYESMLKSYILRKQHLLAKTDSFAAKVAIYKLFMNLAVGSYIKYPNISKLALEEVPNIAVKGYIPSVGGPTSSLLAKLLGWKTTKKLQHLYYQFNFMRK